MSKLIRIKLIPLILLLAVTFTFVQNWPILLHFAKILASQDSFKIGFAISIPLLLITALNLVFIPFSVPYLLKPFFVVLLIAGSITSYVMLKYQVVIDGDMIQNIQETHLAEALAYLNFPFIIWTLLTGFLPALLLCLIEIEYPYNRGYSGLLARVASMLVSLLIIAGIAALYYQDYASIGRNNRTLEKEIIPENLVYSASKFIYKHYLERPQPFEKIGTDATRLVDSDKPTLMFLVIGETARSKNFSMNGYTRATNFFTAKAGGVISFRDVRSCGTATAQSVPCMFSAMTREEFDNRRARNSEGLLDILQRTGVTVLWKENDGGCKDVCNRVPTIQISPSAFPTLCDKETCFDEVLLNHLPEEIASMSGDKLVAFHFIGSHGPTYFKRYPEKFRRFTPDCARSDIENCSDAALMNTYDNTLLYSDWVLSQLIEQLKQYETEYNTVLIYLSDHGESLGEKGLYLHGTPYPLAPDEQTKVPLQVWMSPGYQQAKQLDLACLQNKAASGHYSHDNLFSSILGLWNVKSTIYNRQLDLFQTCRNTPAAR